MIFKAPYGGKPNPLSKKVDSLILCCGQLFEIVSLPANSIMQMIGKHKIYLAFSVISVAIQLVLLFSLIQYLGIIVTAIAASVSTIAQILFLIIGSTLKS